jgi:transcriptional regulator with XRE-family HTH domain
MTMRNIRIGLEVTGTTRPDSTLDRRPTGERIKSARRKAGLTQRELAEKLHVSAGAVGQWETGGVPATERLPTLAGVLGVSLDWLLGKSSTLSNPERQMEDDRRLIEEARHLGVDLHKVVAEARQQRWIEENRDALADANAFLARHGLWSDGKRQF